MSKISPNQKVGQPGKAIHRVGGHVSRWANHCRRQGRNGWRPRFAGEGGESVLSANFILFLNTFTPRPKYLMVMLSTGGQTHLLFGGRASVAPIKETFESIIAEHVFALWASGESRNLFLASGICSPRDLICRIFDGPQQDAGCKEDANQSAPSLGPEDAGRVKLWL